MADANPPANGDNSEFSRSKVAIWVLTVSGSIILGFAIVLIIQAFINPGKDDKELTPYKDTLEVLKTLLPVIGTWVGAVIAYYFGRENYEAANRQLNTVLNKISPEAYKEVPVKQIMIDWATMDKFQLPDGKTKDNLTVEDLSAYFDKPDAKSRLPIVDKKIPLFIFYKEKYVSEKAANPAKLIKDCLVGYKEQYGFVAVSESSTLNQAHEEMRKIAGIDDVFVTADGTQNTEMSGWITDNKILSLIK